MTDNCLDANAQFRFLDSELLQHTETKEALVSSKNKEYKGRLALGGNRTSLGGKGFQYSRDHRLKQTTAGSLSFYRVNVCGEPSGTYVLRKTYCDTHGQKFTFGK
jgi:hypothetical protein